MASSTGVASTPSLLVILLLSTTKGSSNWYCISTSSRMVGSTRPRARSTTGGRRRSLPRGRPACRYTRSTSCRVVRGSGALGRCHTRPAAPGGRTAAARRAAEPAPRPPGLPVHEVDQLPGGAGVGVVGQVPHLTGGVGVLAEDGEALADVGDAGAGVGLIRGRQQGGGD